MSLPEVTEPTVDRSGPSALSLQQEFLYGLDTGDESGSFGAKHIASACWRLRGPLWVDVLQTALDDLVRRHEMLRTAVGRGAEAGSQWVVDARPVPLTVENIAAPVAARRELLAQEFLHAVESGRHPVRELPHLRAFLGRFAADDAVLVLVVHHVAGDGWSMRVLVEDLALRYAQLCGASTESLPVVPQYRDFVRDQRDWLTGADLSVSRRYWREKLADARFTTITADRPAVAGAVAAYTDHRALLDADVTAATLRLARANRASPFMAFLAAFAVLLGRRAETDDVVVGSFSSGRKLERFARTVGPFLNFLPLRIDLSRCRTFVDVLRETRATCLGAYTHELPFPLVEGEAPQLMTATAPEQDILGFELLQFPAGLEGRRVGHLVYTELRERLLTARDSCDIPNGGLWALDVLPSGGTVSSLKLDRHLHDDASVEALAAEFAHLLGEMVERPEALLPSN